MMGDMILECVEVHAEKRNRDGMYSGDPPPMTLCYDSKLRSQDGDVALTARTWEVYPFIPGKRYHVVITPVEE